MVLVKATKQSEAGVMPTGAQIEEMQKFNTELVNAGVLLDGQGLHPTSKAAKIKFGKHERTVIDGPFTESKELVAGFWLVQMRSLEDAVAWFRRAPMAEGDELEIRQVFDMSDFDLTPEQQRQYEELLARSKK
jgi:hypothetical protein